MAWLKSAALDARAVPGHGAGHTIGLGADTLLVTAGEGPDRIELRPAPAPGRGRDPEPAEPPRHRLLAVGVATVDPERFAHEHALGPLAAAGEDTALGARASSSRVPGGGSASRLLLLEPSTEGRLAGWLAREGEGPAVVYVEPVRAAGGERGDRSTVPFDRRGRIVVRGNAWGPFLVIVDQEA